ncbi:MAG TPA: hypothetical protein VFZ16_10725 [Hyphomicrobiaceae bacterium]|nr:hypothetical protein [Hyphomicrobiaceae bacterium]
MAAKKFIVELDAQERARLNALISKGKAPAKAILKARILLKADQAEGAPAGLMRRSSTRWHVVERKIVPAAHFNTVGRALKKAVSSRT